MNNYTLPEPEDAKGAMQSSMREIEKALETLSKKDPSQKSQLTLAKRNIKAFRLAISLIEREMTEHAD